MTEPRDAAHALRLSLENVRIAEVVLEAGREFAGKPELVSASALRAQAFIGLAEYYRKLARDMEGIE